MGTAKAASSAGVSRMTRDCASQQRTSMANGKSGLTFITQVCTHDTLPEAAMLAWPSATMAYFGT